MQLYTPFIISSRLLPALQIADCTISLEIAGQTRDGRDKARVYFDFAASNSVIDEDMTSGCQGFKSTQAAFSTMLKFLSAAAESYQQHGLKGENADLFPHPVTEWASAHCDEIDMLALEIEETPNLIEEED